MIKLITFGSQGISSIILLSKDILDRAVPIFRNLHNTASDNTEQRVGLGNWVISKTTGHKCFTKHKNVNIFSAKQSPPKSVPNRPQVRILCMFSDSYHKANHCLTYLEFCLNTLCKHEKVSCESLPPYNKCFNY